MEDTKIKVFPGGLDITTFSLHSDKALDPPAGKKPGESFEEFLRLKVNRETRLRYIRGVRRLLGWCSLRDVQVEQLTVLQLTGYVQAMKAELAPPTVRLHLAAIRNLFDWLVANGVIDDNPALAILGPSNPSQLPGITDSEKARLIRCIEADTIVDFRDRALIGILVYASTDIVTIASVRVADYFQREDKCWLALGDNTRRWDFEIGTPLKEYLDYYLALADIRAEQDSPFFRKINRDGRLSPDGLDTPDFIRILKRRAKVANVPSRSCCEYFSGIRP
jgi:integrase/recombinase XerD